MTAHELAKKLLELPDVMVTISGYEGGVSEVQNISSPAELALDVYSEWYYGKHEYTQKDYRQHEDKQRISAIHIW